jgi:type 1 glutamine amidotransferase
MNSRWLCIFLLTAAPLLRGVEAPVRVLILSGQNNHDWKTTTPYLRQLLAESGRFTVAVTDTPETLTAADLALAEVLLCNWNTFGAQAADWPAELRTLFLEFVRNGKGLVSVHAGTSSFPDWADYQDLVMGTWKLGQTGHGQVHAFAVTNTQPEHPVMQGLPELWVEDELWHGVPLRGDPTVLASALSAAATGGSGKVEPLVLARTFGQGRSLTLLLGHDLQAMRHPGFRILVTRGSEWAATGKVTLPLPPDLAGEELTLALAAVAVHSFGQDRAPLRRVETLVLRALADDRQQQDLATRLARLLDDPTTSTEGKRFACEQLAIAGAATEVPALAHWVGDEGLGVSARGALERIAGPEATAALRQALATVPESQRPGVVASLGRRRDAAAVALLAPGVDPARPVLAAATLQALAAIGTADALTALLTLEKQAGETLRGPWSEALLRAADTRLRQGDAGAAETAFVRLTQTDVPAHVRRSALRQTLGTPATDQTAALSAALRSDDAVRCGAALDVLRDDTLVPAAVAVACIASVYDASAESTQSQLLAVLEARGGPEALRLAGAALASPAEGVRRRAIAALGSLGGADQVPLLVARAAAAEADAITTALSRLAGDDVTPAIAAALGGATDPATLILVETLLNRAAHSAIPALLQTATRQGEPGAVAVRALGELGDDATFASLVASVAQGHCSAPATVVRQALTDIAQRRPADPARPALAALAAAEPAVQALLVGVLGTLGGDEALTAVAARLTAEAPAEVRLASLRALSGWPTAAPCERLVEVLQNSTDPVEQVLAARGVSRMLGEDSGRHLDARAALLNRAFATRCTEATDELLKGAASVRSPQTFDVLLPALASGSTSSAAAQAIIALAGSLQGSHAAATARALRAVAAECYDSALQDRAEGMLRGVIAGPNLAVGATADSRDGLAPDNEGRGPEAAIDGNPATYWDDLDDQKAYHLSVTLTQPAVVGAIAITGFVHHEYAPKDFEVVADGKVIRTVVGAAYEHNRLLVALPPVRCQTLELRISGYYSKSPAVRELEIFGPPLVEPGQDRLGWERTPGAVSLLNGERTVWRLNYAPGHAKPFFHPLALRDGTVLTWASPPDHPWHHGLWFSWKLINDVNYWEEDKATGQSAGRTSWEPPTLDTRDDFSATIRLALAYAPPDGAPVLREQRTLDISAPSADGGYRLDWTLVFTAVADQVVLERTPIPGEANGVGHGGYAGLSVRVARNLVDWKILNADGLSGGEGHRKPSLAMDFSGTAGGVAAGIAILDHPGNLHAPSPWFVSADTQTPFGYFSPAVICLQAHTLRRGEAFTLRYRVLVHPGALDAASLQGAAADFAK